MQKLKPQHRAVLTMRCYRDMEYYEIAESMGCSEFAVKMLFYRAKKSLRKELSRYGFGKGLLVTTLVLFGKMTAPSEAAAAGVSVTTATTKVGLAAGLVGAATSKAALVTAATAGVVAVGAMVATSEPDKTRAVESREPAMAQQSVVQNMSENQAGEECWYYYPEKFGGSVMMRLLKWDKKQESS